MSKAHYASLSFADNGGRVMSISLRLNDRVITAPIIREAQEAIGMDENAALIGISWLGRQTEYEYATGDRAPYQRRKIITASIIIVLSALLFGYISYLI